MTDKSNDHTFSLRNLSVLAYANGFTLWHYKAMRTPIETVIEQGYFRPAEDMISTGDIIMVSTSDGATMLVVTPTPGVVATSLVRRRAGQCSQPTRPSNTTASPRCAAGCGAVLDALAGARSGRFGSARVTGCGSWPQGRAYTRRPLPDVEAVVAEQGQRHALKPPGDAGAVRQCAVGGPDLP